MYLSLITAEKEYKDTYTSGEKIYEQLGIKEYFSSVFYWYYF